MLSVNRLTGEQIKAARALARIDQSDLARRASLSLETIKRLERIRGPVDANVRTINAIIGAFEALDIRFNSADDGAIGVGRRSVDAAPAPWDGGGSPTTVLHRLIYCSTATATSAQTLRAALDDIRQVSSRKNAAHGVSGALLVSDGRFLQVLEGAKEVVLQVYGAISTDPRHRDLRLIESRAVTDREFKDWSLCCGLFTSDPGVQDGTPDIGDGFHPAYLSPTAALSLLRLARRLQLGDPRTRRRSFAACPLRVQCRDRACAEGGPRPSQEPMSQCA